MSTNISHCIASHNSGFGLFPSLEARVSYCTIDNTSCKNGDQVLGHFNSKTHFVSFCNILNNSQSSTEYGIIHCNGNITLENCSILGNGDDSGTKLFSKAESSIFTVKNCYINSRESISDGISNDNIVIKDSYFNLSHLSTYKCQAPIPIVDDAKYEDMETYFQKLIRKIVAPFHSLNKNSS